MTTWNRTSEFVELPPSSEVIEETALAMAQATIQNAITSARIKRADLAARMGRPRSFVSRMLRGDHNLTIRTFARALAGCGYEVRFNYIPIESSTIAPISWETCRAVSLSPGPMTNVTAYHEQANAHLSTNELDPRNLRGALSGTKVAFAQTGDRLTA